MSRNSQDGLTGQVLPAPVTGVHLGRNKSGPLTLRLFRPRGTRIVVFGDPFVAQLLVLRAAVAGTTVRILTTRAPNWAGVVRHGVDAQIVHPGTSHQAPGGPGLLVDDRPDQPHPLGEVAEWQCLLDVRAPGDLAGSAEAWSASLGHADVVFLGAVSSDLAAAVGRMFGLGDAAAALTVVPPHATAVVTRGSVQLIRPEATPSERPLLRPGSP